MTTEKQWKTEAKKLMAMEKNWCENSIKFIENKRCTHCGKKLLNYKKNKYSFYCDCKDWPKNMIISMG